MSWIEPTSITKYYEGFFEDIKTKGIFRMDFWLKREEIPSLCTFCGLDIPDKKSRTRHRMKCKKLHIVWFSRYHILSEINTLRLTNNTSDKSKIESLSSNLLKLDEIIENNSLKWKLKYKQSLIESLDINLNNFEFIKPLTKGGYGQIFLTLDKITGKKLATKIISISEAIQKSCIGSYVEEREFLLRCKSDFIVPIHYSLRTDFFIYQMMEYMSDGDLSSHLEINRQFPESTVRAILAQLLLALKELKKKGIVHGDIKLENILYSSEKNVVKLADFGLAFEADQGHKSSLGTPEYMSPEQIMESKRGFASDLWAAGICAYEMLFGLPPFYDDSVEVILSKIIGHEDINWNEDMIISKSAKDLIVALLEYDYSKRISLEDAMKHTFFSSIDWSKPPKVVLPKSEKIFSARNKRYVNLQFYQTKIINSEIVKFEDGVYNQNTSIQNQIDLFKIFPFKNLNELKKE